MNTAAIIQLIQRRNVQVVPRTVEQLAPLAQVLGNKEIYAYLSTCLSNEVYIASGVRVCSYAEIIEENLREANPGEYIYPFGYLVVCTSIGGNAVCFHHKTGTVVWADKACFTPRQIAYRDSVSDEWMYLNEYTEANIHKAMVHLADDIEQFLIQLLSDQLEDILDVLD